MQKNKNKTIWRRAGIIVLLVPVCFFFPIMLVVIGWLLWTIIEDLKAPSVAALPPPTSWRDARAEDHDWLDKFCAGCESPAEDQFLRAMVRAFNLLPDSGKLHSPALTLEMQVKAGPYRFDFLANGRQVIEIDGAAWHSSPEQMDRDRIRDAFSVEEGYLVLRIPAKTVFSTPDKAIAQVKAALVTTPRYARPLRPKAVTPRKTFSQHSGAIADGVAALDRFVTVASVKQKALSEFKLALSNEKMLLEALVTDTEREIKLDAMPPGQRKIFNDLLAKLEADVNGTEKTCREDIYCWKVIVKPVQQEDAEIQGQIEKEYQYEMDKRSRWLKQLEKRCVDDPDFSNRFRIKIEETQYPSVNDIFGVHA